MAVTFWITMTLDGYIAGPNQGEEHPLGEGAEGIHDWATDSKSFNEVHGREGGETGTNDDILREAFESSGATIMGRNMFGPVRGPWDEENPWNGWWGEEPPFRHPVYVLTHHEREPLILGETTFNFVTDGIESALEQAQEAAGGKDVGIGGGAKTAQQYIAAGLVDEIDLHVVPILLGAGERLFDDTGSAPSLEIARVVDTPEVTHIKYRVKN
jgi:dihydrofolate reductase